MKQRLQLALQNQPLVTGLYALVAIAVSIHLFVLGHKTFNGIDTYTHYNNYIIFKYAYVHLVNAQDLYIFHPLDQYDLFKYSPAFALFMAPFAALPDLPGLILWNLLNALVLVFAIQQLPISTNKVKVWIAWFVLQECITGLQSAQTNPLIAGLLLLSFVAFENKNVMWASLFIVLTVFIKIFGVLAFIMFLFYPEKLKFIFWSVIWTLILLFIPLVAVSFDQLIFLYKSWLNMLQNDHSISYGLSVMGWLKTWFALAPDKLWVVATGALVMLWPLIRIKDYKNYIFRALFLSGICIWVIIFNHKAESSTFIIAVVGIGLWYFSQKPNLMITTLVVVAFVFTCLSPTDLFPRILRRELVEPFVLKAVPCIFIWGYIQYQLLSGHYLPRNN